MTADSDIDDRHVWVVNTSVIASSVILAAGLMVHVLFSNEGFAQLVLAAGLVLLMATPAFRILIAVVERVRRRDVQFVVVTFIVLLELLFTLWFATTRV